MPVHAPSASSPASATRAASTRRRGTTRASGSPTRSRASSARASRTRRSFAGEVARAGDVRIVKPMTYMNLSGRSVAALARFYGYLPDEILVVHDELDLKPGEAKLKLGGGIAGHNGLRDIQRAARHAGLLAAAPRHRPSARLRARRSSRSSTTCCSRRAATSAARSTTAIERGARRVARHRARRHGARDAGAAHAREADSTKAKT